MANPCCGSRYVQYNNAGPVLKLMSCCIAFTALLHQIGKYLLDVLSCLQRSFSSAVLQIMISTDSSLASSLELQTQVRDYSQLIKDPLCPHEMRDLLVLVMGQIISALILNCSEFRCEVGSASPREQYLIGLMQVAAVTL